MVQKIGGYFLGLYSRFKRDVVPDAAILDKAESSVKTTIDVASKVSNEFEIPALVSTDDTIRLTNEETKGSRECVVVTCVDHRLERL